VTLVSMTRKNQRCRHSQRQMTDDEPTERRSWRLDSWRSFTDRGRPEEARRAAVPQCRSLTVSLANWQLGRTHQGDHGPTSTHAPLPLPGRSCRVQLYSPRHKCCTVL